MGAGVEKGTSDTEDDALIHVLPPVPMKLGAGPGSGLKLCLHFQETGDAVAHLLQKIPEEVADLEISLNVHCLHHLALCHGSSPGDPHGSSPSSQMGAVQRQD